MPGAIHCLAQNEGNNEESHSVESVSRGNFRASTSSVQFRSVTRCWFKGYTCVWVNASSAVL